MFALTFNITILISYICFSQKTFVTCIQSSVSNMRSILVIIYYVIGGLCVISLPIYLFSDEIFWLHKIVITSEIRLGHHTISDTFSNTMFSSTRKQPHFIINVQTISVMHMHFCMKYKRHCIFLMMEIDIIICHHAVFNLSFIWSRCGW